MTPGKVFIFKDFCRKSSKICSYVNNNLKMAKIEEQQFKSKIVNRKGGVKRP